MLCVWCFTLLFLPLCRSGVESGEVSIMQGLHFGN